MLKTRSRIDVECNLIQQALKTFPKHGITVLFPSTYVSDAIQMQELQFVSSSCHSFSSSREPPGDWSLPKRFRRHTQLDTWRKYVFLLNNGSEIERVQITI